MVDALRFELLDRFARVGLIGRVDLEDNKRRARAFGQVSESLRGGVFRIAVGGNNDVVGSGEIELEEGLANASVGTGDQNNSLGSHIVQLTKAGRNDCSLEVYQLSALAVQNR